MDETSKQGVFLRGAAYHSEWIDGVLLAENLFNSHVGEIVLVGVVADMIPKGAFWL